MSIYYLPEKGLELKFFKFSGVKPISFGDTDE